MRVNAMEPAVCAQLLLFRTGHHRCALPINDIGEIVQFAETTHLPGQPAIVEGILNLRGQAVPVIRLGIVFGFSAVEPPLNSAVIVMRCGPAFLVDAVEGIAAIPLNEVTPVSSGHSFNDCATGQFDFEGRIFHLVSPGKILLAEERSRIADLAGQVQARLSQVVDAGA